MRAGVSVIIRMALMRLTLASCTIVLTKRLVVATLPANAERSGILATPSSMITFCPLARLPNMDSPSGIPAPRMASVQRAILSAPLNL